MNDNKVNKRRSITVLERRIAKHLTPFFGGRRMVTITPTDIRAYTAERQAATTITRRAYDMQRKDGSVVHGAGAGAGRSSVSRTPRSTAS